jgi:hypothetical protein
LIRFPEGPIISRSFLEEEVEKAEGRSLLITLGFVFHACLRDCVIAVAAVDKLPGSSR